ncbi:hypothetical protein BKA82DRAFT_3958648, partial [Pisolithus tinctorius]
SNLLMTQTMTKLIVIPQVQVSHFGQLMFLASRVVFWTYNLWFSAPSRAIRLQNEILVDRVLCRPLFTKFVLCSYTNTVVSI